MVKELLQDKKGPGTSMGTRATAAPGPCLPGLLGLPQHSWERARLTALSPAKQGLSRTERDLVAWSHREGNKDNVVNPRRLWAPAGESWSWAVSDPNPDSPQSSWRGGLCERTCPSLYRVAGLSRRIFSKRKRPLGGLWGILQQQVQCPLHLATWRSRRAVGVIKPKSYARWGESAHLGGPETTDTDRVVCITQRDLRPQAPGRVQIKEVPVCTPIACRRVSAWICGSGSS